MKNNSLSEVKTKIQEADSVLVALTKNPGVDELATAIGLSLLIDKMGKKATAIYSGTAPDVLGFLNPEERLDKNVNGLQDFVIAINKDKADHLRYKLDGDFVKVYITPYKSSISEKDLDFSYGDFNVDLVIALNVKEEADLDGALSEYGEMLHSASIVNISTGEGGGFGELQVSDTSASSVGEIVGKMAVEMADVMDGDIATALLTGIVVNTERFSNAKTTPVAMGVAAKLMAAGANQQLISAQINDTDFLSGLNAGNSAPSAPKTEVVKNSDGGQSLDIAHEEETEKVIESLSTPEVPKEAPATEGPVAATEVPAETSAEVEDNGMPKPPILTPMAKVETTLAAPVAQNPPLMPVLPGVGIADTNVQSVIDKVANDVMLKEKKPDETPKEPKLDGNYIGGNPELMKPAQNEDKSSFALPNMTFNKSATEPKEKAPGEDSYLKEDTMKTVAPPVALMDRDVVVKPETSSDTMALPGVQPASPAAQPAMEPVAPPPLPMPGDGLLPPPPLPPVNFE